MDHNSVGSSSPKHEGGSFVTSELRRTRKRVKRACDECRLHKARCDGNNSCETCTRYDRICSYKLTSKECQGPASRIKILEQRLSKANERIAELQQRAQHDDDAHFNTKQKFITPLRELEIKSESDLPLNEMSSTTAIHTPLARSLLGSLLQGEAIHTIMATYSNFPPFRNSSPHDGMLDKKLCQLPTYETALGLIYAAFNCVFGFSNIVMEQTFRIAAQRLYDMDCIFYTPQDTEFIRLFYGTIALGMVKCSEMDRKIGHEKAYQGSLIYFEAANSAVATDDDHESSFMLKVQLRLCLVLYHLETSGPKLARPMLQKVCDVLRSISAQGSMLLYQSSEKASDIMWTVSYLDMQMCSITKLPLLLSSAAEFGITSTTDAINIALSNVANLKRSSHEFLLHASLAMAIELGKITHRLADTLIDVRSSVAQSSDLDDLTDLKRLVDLETALHSWEFSFRTIFPENECDPQLALAGSELQMQLYLAQIDLYHTFIHHYSEHVPMYNDGKFEEISRGRACVVAATNVISHISMNLAQSQATSLTWTSAYTVLISAIVLLVATTYTSTYVTRCETHGFFDTAVQILRSTGYGDRHSKKSYSGLLLDLSSKVVAHIDSITPDDPVPILEASRSSESSRTTTTVSPWGGFSVNKFGASGEWGFDPE